MSPARRPLTARSLTALAAGLLLAPLSGCGSTPEPAQEVEPSAVNAPAAARVIADVEVPILRRTGDANGSPRVYTLVLIEDASDLPGPVGDALKPDFDTEAVVFLGMGEQAGTGYGTQITGVHRTADELVVSADFEKPADGVEASGEPTTPWSAVVIPKQEGLTMPLLSDF